eukprot:jgi/Galph1/2720/GphlegSOOS_G1407.1
MSESVKRKRKRSLDGAPISSPLLFRRSGRRDIKIGPKCTCDYCGIDVTRTLYFRCAECPNFDLCLPCFSVGAELFPHSSSHPYRVISYVGECPFSSDWTAEEEENLLDALSIYGLHNWQLVAEYVRTKSKAKCEQHCCQVYLNGDTAPLPSLDYVVSPAQHSSKESEEGVETAQEVKDNEETAQESRILKSGMDESAILSGFLPKRGDFDVEYDDNAESAIAELQILEDDTMEERELKAALLEIYDLKLQERERKKQVVFEKQFYDVGQVKEALQKLSAEDVKWHDMFFNLKQFMTDEEFNIFIEFLKQDIEYRRKVARLLWYREYGLCTLNQSEEFERNWMVRAEMLANVLNMTGESSSVVVGKQASNCMEAKKAKETVKKSKHRHNKSLKTTDLQPMDLSCYSEDAKNLSIIEKALCSALHLIPSEYMSFRDTAKKTIESRKKSKSDDGVLVLDWPSNK